MNYYTQKANRSKGGVVYTKLVKADQLPLLQKSPNGARYKLVLLPTGQRVAVVVHEKGALKPFRNVERLPKAVRRHRIKAA
jgi:hypothetical protein